MKRKICFVTSGRYDWTRCQTVVEALEPWTDTEVRVVACGAPASQFSGHGNRILLSSALEDDSPTAMAAACGRLTTGLTQVFDQYEPDVVVAMTDRWEALSAATAAALMNITVAHIQGGEVTGTIDESIRHAVTKLAHWHFPATKGAKERIIKMGEHPKTVWNFGCPATDLLLGVKPIITTSQVLCLMHPVTTEWEDSYKSTKAVVDATKKLGHLILMRWIVPNHDAGAEAVTRALTDADIQPVDQDHVTFINVMRNVAVMVGNSSAGIREAGYFGTPVVNVGSRQLGREHGQNVVHVAPEKHLIIGAINAQLGHGRYPPEQLYGDGTAGPRIAEILATEPLPRPQKQISY